MGSRFSAIPSGRHPAPAVVPNARKHPRIRWLLALGAGVCAALVGAALFVTAWLPWTLPLVFVLVPAAQLALSPVWRACGAYRYLSPLLFVVRRGEDEFELHGGTLLDDLERFGWRGRRVGPPRAALYLDGVLALIGEVAAGRIAPEARIVATTHLFGERTARRLGFVLGRPTVAERAHMLLDIATLTVLFSRARGRPALPPVWRVRTGATSAAELAGRRAVVERMRERIEARSRRGDRASSAPTGGEP